MQKDFLNGSQESEARFRAAFQSSAIGMGLLSLDGKILQVNEAVVKMSGYTEEELCQRYDHENVFPEDLDVGMDLFQEMLNGKRDWFQVEKRYVRKNGDVFWARLTLSVVRDPQGHPMYLVGLIDDIDKQRKSVEGLKESETRFRAMFETSAMGAVILDLKTLSVRYNVVALAVFDTNNLPDFLNDPYELIDERYRETEREQFTSLLNGQSDSYTTDRCYRHPGKEDIWMHVTISAVKNERGEPCYIVATLENVTEQKIGQNKLLESEARFRSMFEHSAIGIGVMALDRRLIDANPALCKIFDRTREELTGMNAEEVACPDNDPESVRLFKEVATGQRDSYEADLRYIRKHGDVFWAHVTMSLVRGVDGKPLYLVGMVMDIDERKKMQERIRESEARFQAMFDNISIGMALVGFDRRVISVNQTLQQISGYTAEELNHISISDLVFSEDKEIGANHFREMVSGLRESMQMERRYIRKNGEIFWARICYSLVRDPNGVPQYLVGSMEDITDRKLSAEKLAEQEAEYRRTLEQRVEERTHELAKINQRLHKEIEQRLKIEDELASNAAEEAVTADRTRLARDLHDAVTQTLFSASLTAEVLPDLWEMDVDEAKKSTEELRQLTRGALAEMRTLLLELRPAALTQTKLSDLIKQLCEAFIGRSRLPITLTIEGERDLPPEVQIACYRIAQESLNNVFKYARATQVNVSLFLLPGGLRFEVCDNGLGFDISTTKPTSLGMRIMHERAETIGADLHVSSSPGTGTCVELTWHENPEIKLRFFRLSRSTNDH